jgi:thiol-disulfide isomerase/thioredoxin
MKSHAVILISILAACGGAPTRGAPSAAEGHGKLSDLSRVEGQVVLCDHKVPADVCTRHHPELRAKFEKVGDWCKPHDVPESQCLTCHPDLTFDPLPALPPNADVKVVAHRGEDIGDLAAHAARGKVTLFDFYADWCAACRKVEGHVYKRIVKGDALAYRKLNIVDWDTPLAQKHMKDAATLPLIIVFGRDGREAARLTGADLDALDRAIAAIQK